MTVLLSLLLLGAPDSVHGQPGVRTLWGYVENVDGLAVTLDDGTVVKLTDGTKIANLDGTDGTPADIAKGLKVEFTVDAAGGATRAELLPKPAAPEFYLNAMTVRGATETAAEVKGRVYPRSLCATKASFPVRADCMAFEGGVAYQPPKEAKAPGAVRFVVINSAGDSLFQRSVTAGEASEFRLNIAPGQADHFTLACSAAGEGALQPEWCLWLDPRLRGAAPSPTGQGVFQTTVRALLADLRQALGDRPPAPMAVPLFTNLRVPDDQVFRDLQEDLVVALVGQLPVAGKSPQRPELGVPVPDAVKAELVKMSAQWVLVGSVSNRGDGLVLNVAVVDLGTGEILATARALQ